MRYLIIGLRGDKELQSAEAVKIRRMIYSAPISSVITNINILETYRCGNFPKSDHTGSG